MLMPATPLLSGLCVLTLSVGAVGVVAGAAALLPDEAQLKAMTARFAPVDLVVDLSGLPDSEKAALAQIMAAARIMDALYLRQVWAGNPGMLMALLGDDSPAGRARLDGFLLHLGPWSRIDHDAVFVPGAPVKPAQANFYPADATKEEVEGWLKGLGEEERKAATGFFTTIRRDATRKLVAVPYSVEYQSELALAASHLRQAAGFTTQPTLKDYLLKRADAFLSNDYYDSDLAWMALDSTIELVIGPYETYEDEWFGYKAAFEAFVTIRDDDATQKLAAISTHRQDIENNLPLAAKHRNPKLGATSPIRVVRQVMAAGDGNRGVKTAAFNLPNDERVVKEKGSKQVMLKNVQEAKFHNVLVPISRVVLSEADQKKVSFDAFFTHILMHEVMHGLGPHEITVGGKTTSVRKELKDTYSAIEEAKADIGGLFALQHLVDKGVFPKALEETMYVTFLASAFRSMRFGINEAHGKGQAIQLNWLLDAGAFVVGKDGRFSVNVAKVKGAVKKLSGEILTLEAEGNVAKARDMIAKLGVLRPPTQRLMDQLKDVPVDIAPRFVTAQELLAQP
jgi:hypothetical protein